MPPLLIVGKPGVFKTRFCRELAHALGRRVHFESMAGLTEGAVITGGMRGFRPIEASVAARAFLTGTADPVVILDKLDRAYGGLNGHPHHALLPFLDRESASQLYDRFLEATFDASLIFWIATANSIEDLAPPLADHFVVCEVANPTAESVPGLLELFESDLAIELGANPRRIPKLNEDAVRRLTDAFPRHGDIRRLHQAWRMALVAPELRLRQNPFGPFPGDRN